LWPHLLKYRLNLSSNDSNKIWHGKHTTGHEKKKNKKEEEKNKKKKKKKASKQRSSFTDMKCRGRVGTTPALYSDNIKADLKNTEREDVD
jgi:hypothetical protein